MEQNGGRLFIIGAGFSKPAGLPLGTELLQEIVSYVNTPDSGLFDEYRNLFQGVLKEYQYYSEQQISEINIEE